MNAVLPRNLVLPGRTLSGCGTLKRLPREAGFFGASGILVHGRSLRVSGRLDKLCSQAPPGLRVIPWEYGGGEPALSDLRELLSFAGSHAVDWLAAVGGGSVLDLAKACAGLLGAPRDVERYHDGLPFPRPAIPFLVAPTTAGTGSECTPVSVLTNERTGVKKSIRHDALMARVVILDGEPVADCPPTTVACSGMDAMTQAIEAFVSRGSSWWTDQLALRAVRLINNRIKEVFHGGTPDAAMQLLTGSYLAGLALSNARLGIVHGLAHPLGARFNVPHGLACAACLPLALEFNRDAMGRKWDLLSEAVGEDVGQRVHALLRHMGLASPFRGKTVEDNRSLMEETLASGSTAANPRPVLPGDVEWFLDRLFGGGKQTTGSRHVRRS